MITLRTIPPRKRVFLFLAVAIADLVARITSASFQYDIVLFAAQPENVDLVSLDNDSSLMRAL